MKWLTKRVDPVTLKRLKRFRRIKRAYWSLWILICLYALSLGSEFICNGHPLYVRFEGRSFFPFLRYYPDNVFTGSGKSTRPDYKKLHRDPLFTDSAANFMVFAPIPFGPLENIDPDTIKVSRNVTLRLTPEPRIGSINMREDFSVTRPVSVGFFFGTEDTSARGLNVIEYWSLPDEFRSAIRRRFENTACPSISTTLMSRRNPKLVAEVSMSGFSPRARQPRTVRITFREAIVPVETPDELVFNRSLQVVDNRSATWGKCSRQQKEMLTELAAERFSRPLESRIITVGDAGYMASFDKSDVRWPFRPVPGHWLGIDSAGRDVLARILYGLRTSMTFGLLLVVFSMFLGVVIGAVQGYYGGKVDLLAQRFIEVWSAMPFLYIMILLGAIYGRSFALLLICYGILRWIGISYYMRAEFLKLRKQPFVDCAKCTGLPAFKIIGKHILPNALVPVITFFPFSLVGAIGALAALDYLGFGLPPPTPSWGELLHQAQQFRWAWWLILYPFLALFVVMLLGVFIGEGIRDAYDPRSYSRMR